MGFEDGMGNLPGFDSVQEFLASNATHGEVLQEQSSFLRHVGKGHYFR